VCTGCGPCNIAGDNGPDLNEFTHEGFGVLDPTARSDWGDEMDATGGNIWRLPPPGVAIY